MLLTFAQIALLFLLHTVLSSAAIPTYQVADLVVKLNARARNKGEYGRFLEAVARVLSTRLPESAAKHWLASARSFQASSPADANLQTQAEADLARLVALLKEEDELVKNIASALANQPFSESDARDILDNARISETSAFLVASAKIKELGEKLGVNEVRDLSRPLAEELDSFLQEELEIATATNSGIPVDEEKAKERTHKLDSLRAKLQNLTLNPTDPANAAVAQVLNNASAAVTEIEATAKSSNLRPARIAGTKPN